jgi:hypothetical protein
VTARKRESPAIPKARNVSLRPFLARITLARTSRRGNYVEGYALTALATAVLTGAAYWLTMGRQTLTKKEHSEYCMMSQKPLKQDIGYLKEGQERTERKVDEVKSILVKMNGG